MRTEKDRSKVWPKVVHFGPTSAESDPSRPNQSFAQLRPHRAKFGQQKPANKLAQVGQSTSGSAARA